MPFRTRCSFVSWESCVLPYCRSATDVCPPARRKVKHFCIVEFLRLQGVHMAFLQQLDKWYRDDRHGIDVLSAWADGDTEAVIDYDTPMHLR